MLVPLRHLLAFQHASGFRPLEAVFLYLLAKRIAVHTEDPRNLGLVPRALLQHAKNVLMLHRFWGHPRGIDRSAVRSTHHVVERLHLLVAGLVKAVA